MIATRAAVDPDWAITALPADVSLGVWTLQADREGIKIPLEPFRVL